MRQENRATDTAIAAPFPIVLGRSWASDTRRMVAIAFLRITFGLIWAVDAALKWQPAFQAKRLSADRLIAARASAWRRISS